MKLKNITVQIGGFHDHWLRNGTDNPSVLIAALSKYHYDFICLMDGTFEEKKHKIKKQIEEWIPGFKVHLGDERMYGWGHVVSVMNDNAEFDLQNPNYEEEFLKMKRAGGIVALAHIGYNKTLEEITKKGKIDKLIDENIVDAVQIEDEDDYEYIKHRAENGQKLPLISGWDSHMLKDEPKKFDCIYDETIGVPEHFEHSSFFRTILFAPDNSLEEIKKALYRGESVLEDISTGKLYGSTHLIKILTENGYQEKIKELDLKYNSYKFNCDILLSGESKKIKMPKKGKVILSADSELNPMILDTDDEGYVLYKNIPMPVSQDVSYLPICFSDGNYRRYWAVKICNNIQIEATAEYINKKTHISLFAVKDFCGKIVFSKPYKSEHKVCAKAGAKLLSQEIANNINVFEYEFCAKNNNGINRYYKSKSALLKVHRWHGNWDNAESISIDSREFCGGFGSSRPYPGKDVFSIQAKFLWDDENFYVRYDITDKIYIEPPEGAFMYSSDSQTLNIDPLFERSKSRNSGCEMILGFPKNIGRILCTHVSQYENGKKYIDKKDGTYLNGELTKEETKNGRIVTLKLPWKEITPKKVATGDYMGITVGGLNDEGVGLVDNIQWPWPVQNGGWLFPHEWGTMVLID